MEELVRSLALFRPELALTAGLMLVVVADSTLAAWRGAAARVLCLASLAIALGFAFNLQAAGVSSAIFSGALVVDPLGAAFKVVLVGASLLTVLAFSFRNSRELHGLGQGELYALVLALTLSSLLLAAANDIVMLYLALEMVSITSYVMVAYLKGDRMSNEASLKYVLFGAASTGTMLYGLSLAVRHDGRHLAPGHPGVPRRGRARGEPLRDLRDRSPRDGGLRLQDRRGTVPLLVPGRLPGRGHSRHRAALGPPEGRRPRDRAALLLQRLLDGRRRPVGPRGEPQLAGPPDARSPSSR